MDPSIWWTVASIFALLLLSAFFSGSETALTAASRASLHKLADDGSHGAARALALTEDSERLIGAILLGNNLVNILAASLATNAFLTVFGESGVALATIVMTILVLVFAEVAPKTYAITYPEKAALRVAPVIAIIVRIFAPLVALVRLVVRASLSLVGVRTAADARILTAHEEIRGAIDLHHSEGAVEKTDRDRLLAALDLRDREIEEVMRHRRNIETISADAPPDEIVAFCLSSPHTRIPIWRDEPENIIGVLHARDLLRAVDASIRAEGDLEKGMAALDIDSIAMEPWFVPDTNSLEDQMKEFLRRRTHFALVVDEYGALQGLITLEDILEEIVGDITDEHDIAVDWAERADDGSLTVDGSTTIRDVNRLCDWRLPDDEATTIAGLVIHEAQSIPTIGQVFVFHGFRFEILERKRHQLTRLKLKPLQR